MLLHHPFEAVCERLPDKLALVCANERVTYGELASRVRALAVLLQREGIRRGDRVALFLESSVEFAVAVHAVLRIGAVFVPISAQTKADKLGYMLGDTRASALLTHTQLAAVWEEALARSPSVGCCVAQGATDEERRIFAWPMTPDSIEAPVTPAAAGTIDQDLAAVIYTSGTTGVPKGVMLTHLNMLSAWASVQSYLCLCETDVIGLALSPAFSYGLYHVLMGLGLGTTLLLERSVAFPVKVVEHMAAERVTVFPGVPTLYSSILGIGHLASFDLSALRILTNAAAALPEAHLRRLRERLPQARIFSMYGMTECKRISYLPPEQLDARPGSVGRGLPNQDLWVVDDQGRRLPDGSTGELVVRGSHVMRGYWEKPAETAARLRPGPIDGERVLYTGDLFRTDAEGWLYFVARSDEIIKSRGEKVAPREVENAIYAMPGVRDCAVIGVPDVLLGEAVKAFVVRYPATTISEREVIRHCMTRLESYMAPKSVVFMDELPRTDTGKIRKLDLR